MLNILFMEAYPEDVDAEKASGLRLLQDGDAAFFLATQGVDLSKDKLFLQWIDIIDRCDILAPNVVFRRSTKTTHPFDKVSGGVKTLWLMNHYNEKYIFPSAFLGENCYQSAIDIGCTKDIYIYDDSDMFFSESKGYSLGSCHGKMFDFYRKEIVDLDAEHFNRIEWFDSRY